MSDPKAANFGFQQEIVFPITQRPRARYAPQRGAGPVLPALCPRDRTPVSRDIYKLEIMVQRSAYFAKRCGRPATNR